MSCNRSHTTNALDTLEESGPGVQLLRDEGEAGEIVCGPLFVTLHTLFERATQQIVFNQGRT